MDVLRESGVHSSAEQEKEQLEEGKCGEIQKLLSERQKRGSGEGRQGLGCTEALLD